MKNIYFLLAFMLFYICLTAQTTLPPEMVFVEGGIFTMGCTPEQQPDCSFNESPTRLVRISSFEIGKFEVTQGEWQAVMGNNPSAGAGISPDRPVYNISYFESITFCNRLSLLSGLTPCYYFDRNFQIPFDTLASCLYNVVYIDVYTNESADGYRLLFESEWEYAARGGRENLIQTKYSGSNSVDEVAWYHGNNVPSGTKPVGSKLPNNIGVFDLSGNVIEWCFDWYAGYGSAFDGCVPFYWYPIRRGGEAWNNTFPNEKPRVASRYQKYINWVPCLRDPYYGLRLARNAD